MKYASSILLACLLALPASPVASKPSTFSIPDHGRIEVVATRPEGETISIVIVTAPFAHQVDDSDKNAYLYVTGTLFGREDDAQSSITSIFLRWGKSPTFVLSMSAYSDLFDPRQGILQWKGRELILQLSGGDGAVGYDAELKIAPFGVTERQVRHKVSGYREITRYQHTAKQIGKRR